MPTTTHDTIAYRLAQILVKLNQGEKLSPQALANEFGVTLRTIQRDLNNRFAYLPLQKNTGLYHLDPTFLGKLSIKDIERFAALAGIHGLFPSLLDDFLRDIFDASIQSTLLVKGHHYENLAGKNTQFSQLKKAIIHRQKISFNYVKPGGVKTYLLVSPYKLINSKGIWYLAALDNERLKTFSFSKIEQLESLDLRFSWDAKIDEQLANDESVWLSKEKQKITIEVGSEIAAYFKRRQLIANQVIENELPDGTLIISTLVGHENQILPIVRYWIPHIRIISPLSLQIDMEKKLAEYLARPINNCQVRR
jgi:predicted DNA-binding transcriptional regulator YafY